MEQYIKIRLDEELMKMINDLSYVISTRIYGVYTELRVDAKDLNYNLYMIDTDMLMCPNYHFELEIIDEYLSELRDRGVIILSITPIYKGVM